MAAGSGAAYEMEGLREAPDPPAHGRRSPRWCAERGLLITELRLGSASLEERYLELVGADVAEEAEGDASPARGAGVPPTRRARHEHASVGAGGRPGRRPGSGWRWRWPRTSSAWLLRRGEGLLITFVIPAGVLLVFSAFDTGGGRPTGDPVDRLLPGSIVLAIIAASLVSLAIATGYERRTA